jgi:hypothetical protein
MRKVKVENINAKRLDLAAKGYLTPADLQIYCQCGYKRAKDLYRILVEETEAEGKRVSVFGINPDRVNNYLGITEQSIKAYAAQGL